MTTEEIAQQIILASSRDAKTSVPARHRLEALGGEAIEPLLVNLAHPHVVVRKKALQLLRAYELALPTTDLTILPYSSLAEQQRQLDMLPTEPSALVLRLGTHDAILRHAIAQRLVVQGEAAKAALLAALTLKRSFVARRAAAVLAYQGVGDAVAPIFHLWQETASYEEQLRDSLLGALAVLLKGTPEVPLTLLIEILAAPGAFVSGDNPYGVKVGAAKCVVRQAEKYRTPEYRLALPYLKSTYTDLSGYHAALERVLKAVPNATLPIPAEPSLSPHNLPIPTEER
ncbi:hypothetical protein [Armatimonas rosea]|uniref:HEAT repeat domain-containing protein n=1 Tax=Armatimonas rosea TaxID=685828 RepID=A0A7W9W5Z2_ARMRO|nr:hypothetical protein [Armatimonas rosea]MBB6050929.1 hypothetical protein [Armatimonas rosea]